MLEHRERYLWVDGDVGLAWTVAAIEGSTHRGVVAAYGGERKPEPIGLMEFAEAHVAEDDLGECSVIQIVSHGRYVVVLENNGWLGVGRDVAQRASDAGDRFFGVYWSPSGDRIVQATNGN